MKYNCRFCDFKWEGVIADFHYALEHEKIHPENNIDTRVVTEEPVNSKCRECGCEGHLC